MMLSSTNIRKKRMDPESIPKKERCRLDDADAVTKTDLSISCVEKPATLMKTKKKKKDDDTTRYDSGSVEDDSDESTGNRTRKRRINELSTPSTNYDNSNNNSYSDYSSLPAVACECLLNQAGLNDSTRNNCDRQDIPLRLRRLPSKLNLILSNPDYMSIISWNSHGRSWKIQNRKAFVDIVLPKFFDFNDYKTFIQNVKAWGFRRKMTVGPDQHAYYHELFLRGMPHLHGLMSPLSSDEKKKRTMIVEPDFNTFSPLPQDELRRHHQLDNKPNEGKLLSSSTTKDDMKCRNNHSSSDSSISSSSTNYRKGHKSNTSSEYSTTAKDNLKYNSDSSSSNSSSTAQKKLECRNSRNSSDSSITSTNDVNGGKNNASSDISTITKRKLKCPSDSVSSHSSNTTKNNVRCSNSSTSSHSSTSSKSKESEGLHPETQNTTFNSRESTSSAFDIVGTNVDDTNRINASPSSAMSFGYTPTSSSLNNLPLNQEEVTSYNIPTGDGRQAPSQSQSPRDGDSGPDLHQLWRSRTIFRSGQTSFNEDRIHPSTIPSSRIFPQEQSAATSSSDSNRRLHMNNHPTAPMYAEADTFVDIYRLQRNLQEIQNQHERHQMHQSLHVAVPVWRRPVMDEQQHNYHRQQTGLTFTEHQQELQRRHLEQLRLRLQQQQHHPLDVAALQAAFGGGTVRTVGAQYMSNITATAESATAAAATTGSTNAPSTSLRRGSGGGRRWLPPLGPPPSAYTMLSSVVPQSSSSSNRPEGSWMFENPEAFASVMMDNRNNRSNNNRPNEHSSSSSS